MRKENIGILQQHAINKGGKLVSTDYINSSVPCKWSCINNHIWLAAWGDIKRGNWCRKCTIQEKTHKIEILQQYAISKGGKLVSTDYISSLKPLLWECKEGHRWNTRWNNIKNRNQWCPTCDGQTKPTLSILEQHAKNKRGILLTKEYKNCETKMSWQCEKGHKWEAKWHSIKRGDWCPKCCVRKCELECKILFEAFFAKPFEKHRIYYDTYNKHKFYELDGYNMELRIAFEYNGKQHYEHVSRFHTKQEFYDLQKRDREKKQYCENAGIKLIVIPYTKAKLIKEYIEAALNG